MSPVPIEGRQPWVTLGACKGLWAVVGRWSFPLFGRGGAPKAVTQYGVHPAARCGFRQEINGGAPMGPTSSPHSTLNCRRTQQARWVRVAEAGLVIVPPGSTAKTATPSSLCTATASSKQCTWKRSSPARTRPTSGGLSMLGIRWPDPSVSDRTSTGWIVRSGELGARTPPSAETRRSHQGSRPKYPCGPSHHARAEDRTGAQVRRLGAPQPRSRPSGSRSASARPPCRCHTPGRRRHVPGGVHHGVPRPGGGQDGDLGGAGPSPRTMFVPPQVPLRTSRRMRPGRRKRPY